VRKVTKGENPWTEHYSAVQAEVPDDDDPRTQLNRTADRRLDQADAAGRRRGRQPLRARRPPSTSSPPAGGRPSASCC
jgi:hypothetical protein